jgi:hypothetical protein
MMKATKEFDILEETTTNYWYRITIMFRGVVVDEFLAPTMFGAYDAMKADGYKFENQ